MDYKRFVVQLCEDMKVARSEVDFSVRDVNKLQGESYTGITATPEGRNVGVTLNLEPFYQDYQSGASYEDVFADVVDMVDAAIAQMPEVDASRLTDYEQMKDTLILQVIPTEGNEEMLAGIPHQELADLAVVARFQLNQSEAGQSTILVTNQMLDVFGITAEQLMKDAAVNSPQRNPASLRNMSEVMAEFSGGLFDMPPSPMWVATVESQVNGAGVLAYPGFLDQAAKQLGGDFYVLPSSIHEALLIHDDGSMNAQTLSEMVTSVNETEVLPSERLSDVAYHYDAEAHIFEKAQDFEDRMAGLDAHEMEQEAGLDSITVLMVNPGEKPREVTVGTDLESLQQAVGGFIQVVYPFEDNVGLVMNEEGKLNGLPLNRALRDEDGEVYDIVAGSFMVVGLTEGSFGSLTPEQMQKYSDVYQQPETFVRMGKSIMAIPIPDEAMDRKEEKTARKVVDLKPKKTELEH